MTAASGSLPRSAPAARRARGVPGTGARARVVALAAAGLLAACSGGGSPGSAAGSADGRATRAGSEGAGTSRSSDAVGGSTPSADTRPPLTAASHDPTAVLVYLVRARTAPRHSGMPAGTVLLDVDPVRWAPVGAVGAVGADRPSRGEIVNDAAEVMHWPLSSRAAFYGGILLADGAAGAAGADGADGADGPVRLDRQTFLEHLRATVAAGHLVPAWLVRATTGSHDVVLVQEQAG